ncbi:helicase, partial [Leptospira interrogans serovar Pomona]|nr:helicase [Leptospira interrogans serovar Pomona]
NLNGDKYKISLEKYLDRKKMTEISEAWKAAVKAPKQLDGMKKFYSIACSEEGIDLTLQSLADLSIDTLVRIYLICGVSEAEDIRSYVVTSRGKYEQIIPSLILKGLIVDVCFVDEKFVRVFVIPDEILKYVQTHPILPSVKKGTKQRTEKLAT